MCLLRIVPVLFAYFILSLAFVPLSPRTAPRRLHDLTLSLLLARSYTLINKAFLLPTDGNGYASFGPQAGFMVLWMLDWVALASLGLAMEAMCVPSFSHSLSRSLERTR